MMSALVATISAVIAVVERALLVTPPTLTPFTVLSLTILALPAILSFAPFESLKVHRELCYGFEGDSTKCKLFVLATHIYIKMTHPWLAEG